MTISKAMILLSIVTILTSTAFMNIDSNAEYDVSLQQLNSEEKDSYQPLIKLILKNQPDQNSKERVADL